MAKFFKFKDIEKTVLMAGFEQVKNNGGSHQLYRDEKTGLIVTIPNHPAGVSIGVGQKVLEMVVLVARINNVNIGAKSNKHETNIANYILEHHQKCKKNLMFLVPEEIRMVKGIENESDVRNYLKENENRYKSSMQYKQKVSLQPSA